VSRRGGTARPLVLFTPSDEGVLVCGPDGSPPPVALLNAEVAGQIFRRVLEQSPVRASLAALALIGRAQGSGNVPGFRNRSLVSTHFVTQVLPREQGVDWTAAAGQGQRALGETGEALVRALGYGLKAVRPREYQVEDDGQPVAIAHVYDEGTNLDRVLAGQSAPPASHALQRADELRLDHALLVAGSLLRIYSLQAEETLDESAASAAYVEFDTSLLPPGYAPLLGALAAPDALRPNGRLARIREESGRYAVGLRERFTNRLYEEVVDRLVSGIWEAAHQRGLSPLPDEDQLYRSTLVLLFRSLFLLYAEDRNLLPMQNAEYRRRSITQLVIGAAQTVGDPARDFDPVATSLWGDLRQLFNAIRVGNSDWGVPPYGGGLFEDDGLDGGLLGSIQLPNKVVGEALYRLGWDEDDSDSGKIDFGDLGVRQLGTIYEGLLSYEVAFATEDLRVDRRAEGQPYVPVVTGEQAEVPAGTPHIRSPMGGRKATGSYYTPAFAVQRLVDKAVKPALDAHLSALPADADAIAFFDLRVCDPAMGSGHFLVTALDVLADGFAASLARRPVPAVADEMTRARDRLVEVGRAYGAPDLADQVADIDLLRRLVLKRCIYGVDYNPMAVELARLGLWLHSLVPGLPLSYLGHTLQHGNSLVGVGADAPDIGIFGQQAEAKARDAAGAVASITDLELGELEESRRREAEVHAATRGLHDLYDLLTAEPLVDQDFAWVPLYADEIVAEAVPSKYLADVRQARIVTADVATFHWRLAYPEVFLRDHAGFDVIVGNPPWEEATVERLGFYLRYLPGLQRNPSAKDRERQIHEFEARYTTVRERFEEELGAKEALRRYLNVEYSLQSSGDPDLYRAFGERFLNIVAQNGRIGVVLPRSALAGDGTRPFREALFGRAQSLTIDVLKNWNGWVFASVSGQYTLILLSAQLSAADDVDATLSTCALVRSRAAFDRIDAERVDWTVDQLRAVIPDLGVPILADRKQAELFQRLVTSHPRFDSGKGGWRALPWAEFHGTKDRKSGLLKEPGDVTGEWWPVYGGRSFDLWQPELWKADGELQFVLQPKVGLAELQQKRLRSSVWKAFPSSVLRDPATLPMHHPRILFRDVTRATDSRTVHAALVPPHVFAINSSPSLVWPSGDACDVTYLLGVMASLPFDWLARRRVETHLNYFILNSLAVPRPTRSDERWQRVVQLAGRLGCLDDRYASFAEQVGVVAGPVETGDNAAMIAELDAVIAHLYGLTRDNLEAMFEDFPETDAAISPGRRAATLEWYDRWAS
jgi:hypothetical protein